MQTGNIPPTWQSNQPQIQNQPQPPSPPPFNMPPKRPTGFRNWFRTGSQKTKLGFGLIIVALLLCIFAVYIYGSSTQATKVTSTPTTTGNTVAAVSPGATNALTKQPTLNTGFAILGARLSTFIAKFGQQNDHSSPGQIHFARCGNSNTDQLILSPLSTASSPVPISSVLYASCTTWTVSTAEALCSKFFPADAVFQKTVIIPGSPSQFPAFVKVYYSVTLAREFGADNFTDAHKNPVKSGLFDVSYLYENSNDTMHVGSCNVQLGMRQTQ